MFNKWYVKWLSISYHYSLLTILFKWFIFLIVYLFIIYLTYWKSITYQETIDCFSCFSCLQPFCENAWMMAFANFWFGGNLREWFEWWLLRILIWWQFARMIWGQKIFLPMDMALYTIYKGHSGTAAGGLISTKTKFSKYKNLFG